MPNVTPAKIDFSWKPTTYTVPKLPTTLGSKLSNTLGDTIDYLDTKEKEEKLRQEKAKQALTNQMTEYMYNLADKGNVDQLKSYGEGTNIDIGKRAYLENIAIGKYKDKLKEMNLADLQNNANDKYARHELINRAGYNANSLSM